jgi:hypothetical protein
MKDNAVGIVVGGLVLIYMMANTKAIQIKTENEKDILTCQTLCFPQQSEYITRGQTNACWCYVNQTTMNKAE